MGEPTDRAFTVTAEGGEVMVDGEGVALSMTVEAAQELADQLSAAVVVALGQWLTKAPQADLDRRRR